jgi:cation diffusion facilitator CzcD-associated flavoprotein CzcO
MNLNSENTSLPIVVIGAGPVGLAAASHLVAQHQSVIILEAGDRIAANLESYRQVGLFSRWRHNVDPVAVQLLSETNWQHPDPEVLPTAAAIIDQYLSPLAQHAAIAPHLKLQHRVTHIARQGYDKVKTNGRETAPFVVHAETPQGTQQFLAAAVIDAAGTWTQPNPLGANGFPAIGETGLKNHIWYGMPDVVGTQRQRYAGKRVLVVGTGHSAVGNLLALAELAETAPATSIVWCVRRKEVGKVFGNVQDTAPSVRAKLGIRLKALVETGLLELHTNFHISALHNQTDGIEVIGEAMNHETPRITGIDEIIAATGARPDLEMTRELRTRQDCLLESTETLAPLIDPNIHSCGMVRPPTWRDLAHPETRYFTVGAKSYGRAPNFLMVTGYEQVQVAVEAVLASLAGRDPALEAQIAHE